MALWGNPGEIKPGDTLGERSSSCVESATPEEVWQSVVAQDKQIMEQGLEKLGFKPETLQKLRDLDGLASNGGKFLSVSIQMMYKSYFMQLMKLWERSQEIEAKYLNDDNLPPKEKAFYFRMYTDMVKEHGRGYQLMFQGAESLIAMLQAAGNMPIPIPAPSATPPKAVNAKPKKERPGFAPHGD